MTEHTFPNPSCPTCGDPLTSSHCRPAAGICHNNDDQPQVIEVPASFALTDAEYATWQSQQVS